MKILDHLRHELHFTGEDYGVERPMRDAEIAQLREGTSRIQPRLIGRSFVRKAGA